MWYVLHCILCAPNNVLQITNHLALSLSPPSLHMQGSRWTLQALRMNGQLGELQIQPDQMQALNPILILVFIPIFELIIYPIFAKCHLLKRWVFLFNETVLCLQAHAWTLYSTVRRGTIRNVFEVRTKAFSESTSHFLKNSQFLLKVHIPHNY